MTGLILMGGKGERLQGVIPMGMPKCAVMIGGRPVWQYATMAAAQMCDGGVMYAPGPFADIGIAGRIVPDNGQGTVAVVRAAKPRPLAVFNGDTILFGAPTFDVPGKPGLYAVQGHDLVNDRNETAFYIVVRGVAFPAGAKNLEDVRLTDVIEVADTLSFIDCGTVAGLQLAQTRARTSGWS